MISFFAFSFPREMSCLTLSSRTWCTWRKRVRCKVGGEQKSPNIAAFGTGEKRYCNERSHIACIIQKLPIWDLEMGGAMGYYMGKGAWAAVIGRSTV